MPELVVLGEDGPWQQFTPEAAQVARAAHLDDPPHVFATRGISPSTIHRVYAFRDGLVRQDHARQPQAFRWDMITETRESVSDVYLTTGGARRYQQTRFTFALTRRDGARVKIAGAHQAGPRAQQPPPPGPVPGSASVQCHRYFEFGKAACAEVARARLPAALASLDRGESVAFGSVRVSRTGLRRGMRRPVPWAGLTMRVSEGWLTIERHGSRRPVFRKSVADIPSSTLFRTVVTGLLDGS
ncbi:hypothetical protein [Streptomyces odontomachi]|uniref:hypothetical protein n=1 Tax=Streptomyces odontomachi TaxID=2944940 RepID=UPI00210BFCDE|nr:hypothetical protein [Streptomyces sp. ODS25]